MEVSPPQQVWDRLSIDLDEINGDNLLAAKIHGAKVAAPSSVWERINDSLSTEVTPQVSKRAVVINFKRVAVAAIFLGIIISAWLIIFKPQQTENDIATTVPVSIEENNSTLKTEESIKLSDTNTDNKQPSPSSLSDYNKSDKLLEKNNTARSKNNNATFKPAITSNTVPVIPINEKPGEKSFNQPIDDLSMIAANDNYVTMVNSNGRIVKIPANYAHLASHLQDKPITEDYYEKMFREGAYWKEKVTDWKQKLATSPVSTGDLFSNMVELLKTVEARPDNPIGQGK